MPVPEPLGGDFSATRLRHLARQVWPGLPEADVDAAVDAGALSALRDGGEAAEAFAIASAGVAARLQRQGPPPDAPLHLDWQEAGLGVVIPVLPASPGAGATVAATVIADALQLVGWRVLQVDTADPARSGLSVAAASDGPLMAGPDQAVRIRLSWRGRGLLAQLRTDLPVLSPGMVPPPPHWAPVPMWGSAQITVADLSYDAWRLAANLFTGPGMWLRDGRPTPRPVLVVRPTRPSLRAAEQVLARLETWIAAGIAVPPIALLVTGAKRWPEGVAGAAGRRVHALMDRVVFLPQHSTVETAGITSQITPEPLRNAVTPLLRQWGLAPESTGRKTRIFRGNKEKKGDR
ncbi:hypothetical protein AB0L13_38890 [Saccharopolyspora shandongensis]|uniref:hypothetical protein n=1 Tax=Saccharopolyspora shandongensis TaxID=418495 RepID=UPI0034441932